MAAFCAVNNELALYRMKTHVDQYFMQKVSFLADSDTVVNYDRKMIITLDRGGGGQSYRCTGRKGGGGRKM